jgi:DNA-binding beta-propeller fold protein YncE
MDDDAPPNNPGERLESWKEIAAYLKRDVRTARRWEKAEGLPVRRHVHHKLASVYAYASELDAWRTRRDSAAIPRAPDDNGRLRSRRALAAAAVVLLAAAALAIVILSSRSSQRASGTVPIRGRLLARATGEGQQPAAIGAGPPVYALTMSPDGTQLYATDRDGRALLTVATATNRVTDRLPLNARPTEMAASPDGRWLYLGSEEGDLLRIDVTRRSIDVLAHGLAPIRDVAVTPDGRRLYIAAVFNGMHALDTRTGRIENVPTVGCPMHFALVPGKDLLYVAYQCGGPGGRSGHDAIDVRTASTGTVRATISGPPHVGAAIRVSPDGAQVWADGNDACISAEYDRVGCPLVPGGLINIYRTDDNYLLGSLGLPGSRGTAGKASGISFFRDGSRAIVGGAALRVVDARSLHIVEQSPWAAHGGVQFTPDGRRAYLSLQDAGIAAIDFGEDRCVPPPSDLAGWWPGDGHANDVREDSAGELRGGAAFAPAWIGQGFALDGRAAHVLVSTLTNVDMAADFTLAVWMKPAAIGRSTTILEHAGGHTAGWRLTRDADGRVSFCDFPVGESGCTTRTARSEAPVRAGAWTHVAASAAGRRLSLFVDGELAGSADIPARAAILAQNFRIGGSAGDGGFFAGVLDEVQLYRRALSIDDVRRVFGAGRSGLCYR